MSDTVPAIRLQEAASRRLDEIYRYARQRSGRPQAEHYIRGLFQAFEDIHDHRVLSRPVPAAFGVSGYFFRYQKHFAYWRTLCNGDIGIVTILHASMHRMERFREDAGADDG